MAQELNGSAPRNEGLREYVKPVLLPIELKAEEGLSYGCKTRFQGSGWPNVNGEELCGLLTTACVGEGS